LTACKKGDWFGRGDSDADEGRRERFDTTCLIAIMQTLPPSEALLYQQEFSERHCEKADPPWNYNPSNQIHRETKCKIAYLNLLASRGELDEGEFRRAQASEGSCPGGPLVTELCRVVTIESSSRTLGATCTNTGLLYEYDPPTAAKIPGPAAARSATSSDEDSPDVTGFTDDYRNGGIFDVNTTWFGNPDPSSFLTFSTDDEAVTVPIFGEAAIFGGDCPGEDCSMQVEGLWLFSPSFEFLGVRLERATIVNNLSWPGQKYADETYAFEGNREAMFTAQAELRVRGRRYELPIADGMPSWVSGKFVDVERCLPGETPPCDEYPGYMTLEGTTKLVVDEGGLDKEVDLTLYVVIPFGPGSRAPAPEVDVRWVGRNEVGGGDDWGWRFDASGTDWGRPSNVTNEYEWSTSEGLVLSNDSVLVLQDVPPVQQGVPGPYPLQLKVKSAEGSERVLPIPFPPSGDCDINPAACAVCRDGELADGEFCEDSGAGDCCSTLCEVESQGHVCRIAMGVCDTQETCDGVASTCPADVYLPDEATCSDGKVCTGGDRCQAGICEPTECRTSLACAACGASGSCGVNTAGACKCLF
jgi:hypothetical protein